jgi:uncharacterized membrane protein
MDPDAAPTDSPPTSASATRRTGPTSRYAAVSVAVALAVALAGMVLLWPTPTDTGPPRTDAAQRATITAVTASTSGGEQLQVTVTLRGDGAVGPAGTSVTVATYTDAQPDLNPGDHVKVIATQLPAAGPDGTWQMVDSYQLIDYDRSATLWLLGILFAGVIVIVGGLQGIRSLAGLGVSLSVVISFVIPAILAGRPPVAVAVAAGTVIMIVTLYASHGRGPHVTAAVLGTLTALGVTAALGVTFVKAGHITGLASEHAYAASVSAGGLDLTGLVLAGLIIATLGVLDDVTIAQASTVWALHHADPALGRTQLFARAMTVGRDHIAAVVNTLFLAYTGASLALLVLFHTSGLPAGEIVSSEAVAEELIKTLVGSIGLTLAVPLTTALAAALVTGAAAGPGPHAHHSH